MKENDLGRLYEDGDFICCEGDLADSMYVIQSGYVEVIKKMPEGEVSLANLKSGDFFGEMSLFDHLPRSASIKATGKARVLTVDKKKFFSKASEDPSFAFNLLEGMSKRIRSLDSELSKFKKKI